MVTYAEKYGKAKTPLPEYKRKGYRLKFYYDEIKRYPIENQCKLNQKEALDIIEFLAERHNFKVYLTIFKDMKGGKAFLSEGIIHLPLSPPLLFIVHELAHLCNHQKLKNSDHDKKLMKTIDIFMKTLKKSKFASDLQFTKPLIQLKSE